MYYPKRLRNWLLAAGCWPVRLAAEALGRLRAVPDTSAKGRTIAGTRTVSDNCWHKLVLTHYYARGLTHLYVDSLADGQRAAERLRPSRLDLGSSAAPACVQLRDFMFYRAGMNEGEVLAMAADSLLKSSLKIYAPLDGSRAEAADSLTNLAQRTNTLSRLATPLAACESAQAAAIGLYPNPSTGPVHLQAPRSLDGTMVQLFDLLGRAVLTAPVRQNGLDMSALPMGVYTLQLQLNGETVRKRLVRQAE